jgi:SPP1 gp7 family putative phage head morphogenesis protein
MPEKNTAVEIEKTKTDKKIPTTKIEVTAPKEIERVRFAKNELLAEKGVPNEMYVSSYYNEERRVDDLSILDYRKMRDNDGQVQMILNAIYNTIQAAGFEVEDDDSFIEAQTEAIKAEEANNKPVEIDPTKSAPKKEKKPVEVSEEKKFIERLFNDPKWKLGMSEDIRSVNRNFLRAIEEGYRVYEVIYRSDPDGMIRLDRLAPRAIKYSDEELKLIADDHGNFIGFHQKATYAEKVVDIFVKNDSDIHKAILVVYGGQYGSNYGRPALKPVFYHYDKAHKGMYLNHVGHELGANKFKVLYTEGNVNQTTVDSALNILQRTGQLSTIVLNKQQFTLEMQDASDANVMAQGREMIQYHTGQMSKALLAQFIDLGTKTTGTGARSLGEDQMDFFKVGLQSIAEELLDSTWNLIIADLIKINFNKGIYPRYKTNKINDNTVAALYDTFMELIKKDAATDSVKAEIIGKTAENLGLDINAEDIAGELEAKKMDDERVRQETFQQEQQNIQTKAAVMQKMPNKVNLSDYGVETEVEQATTRSLYPNEQNVKFVDIKYKLDQTRDQGEILLTRKLESEKNGIVNRYTEALREGRKSIKNIKVQLAENETTYLEELTMLALGLVEFGKLMAAGEIGKAVPMTSKAVTQATRDMVEAAVAEQSSKLQFRLQSVANDSLDQGIPENETRLRLEQEFDNFINGIVAPTLGAIIPKAFNRGRQVSFDKYQDSIFAYRYTAVLDNRTTDYCRSLDGRVLQKTDPNYPLITPPNHFGCRSFWTQISVDQSKGVRVDGKPFDLPTYSSISTFRDTPTELTEKVGHENHLHAEISNLMSQL